MTLYSIRHGQTEWNLARRLQGQSDVPLALEGRELARTMGEQVASIPFDLIVSSPLCRAKETAQILRGERDIPIRIDERMREISFGDMEGTVFESQNGESYVDAFHRFFSVETSYIPPAGGETLEAVMDRISSLLLELTKGEMYRDQTILLVGHGVINQAISLVVQKKSPQDFWGEPIQKNCELRLLLTD